MNLDKGTPELFAALSKAMGEIENATKNKTNPHFRNNYADLSEVLNTIRPTFSQNGLALIQSTSYDGSLVSVTTAVTHSSGGSIMFTASCVPAKSDAQGIGSATTYLRRYSAASVAGIAQEDDDGNSSQHDNKSSKVQSPTIQQEAIADELSLAISDSQTEDDLKKVAKQIAGSKFPDSLRDKLRKAYEDKMNKEGWNKK